MDDAGEISGAQLHVLEPWRWTANPSVKQVFLCRFLLAADYVTLRDDKSQAFVYEIGFTGESRVCPESVCAPRSSP